MFSKHTKVKNCHPDRLYELLLERHFQVYYRSLEKLVLHHAMNYRDGKIVVALELRFSDKIIFENVNFYIDEIDLVIIGSNTKKFSEYLK